MESLGSSSDSVHVLSSTDIVRSDKFRLRNLQYYSQFLRIFLNFVTPCGGQTSISLNQ